ncbi:hypothetical protein Angca_008281, partial [Angiostrongylus cantonensis]
VQFEIDKQNPSGCFDLERFSTDGITICYRNVSNVVVRLSKGYHQQKRLAVLLNCHYDSWPTSPGGSDDLISCALMMELIRLLARQPDMLTKYDVVFLFNGAEESILQGAHGFITQHRWRDDIRAFINLEASGSGGRELLFQAGPSNQWLLNSYLAAAVYPHCSIIAQEIFQSGLFPGDTDFRVFRDYGKIPVGLDLAFVQNGYWWHTEFDEARRITPGSLQRAGDNVYATLLYLLQSPYLNSSILHDIQKYVFFDVLGLFVVVYPETVANSIHAVLIIAVLLKVSTHFFHYEYYKDAIADYIVVIATMGIVVTITSYLTLFIWGAMPWYSIHGLAVLIYGVPALWTGTNTMLFLTSRVDGQSKEDHATAIENVHQLLIAIILTVFTLKGLGSGYLFALMLFPIVKDVIPLTNEWTTVSTYLLLNLPCFVMFIYLSEMLLSIFIPIMGRTDSNPERIVAVFTTLPVFVIVLSLLPLLTITTTRRDSSATSLRSFICMIAGIVFTTAVVLFILRVIHRSPYNYSDAYPIAKRIQLFHVNRALHKKDGSALVRDSGLYVIAKDYRGVEDIPFVDENYSNLACRYESPYCEIPFYFPKSLRIQDRYIRYKVLIGALVLPVTRIMLLNKEESKNTIVYKFLVRGSGQMSVFIVPQSRWQIANCSLSESKQNLYEGPMFIFLTCNGLNCGDWSFQLTLKVFNSNVIKMNDDETRLLLGVASHYLHGPHMQSSLIKHLLSEISKRRHSNPSWSITASAWNVDLIYQLF